MKKAIAFLSVLLYSATAFAGSITLTWDDSKSAQIVDLVTYQDTACGDAEAPAVCAQRMIRSHFKDWLLQLNLDKKRRDDRAEANTELVEIS